jgi:hypothetical protein
MKWYSKIDNNLGQYDPQNSHLILGSVLVSYKHRTPIVLKLISSLPKSSKINSKPYLLGLLCFIFSDIFYNLPLCLADISP